MVNIQILVNEGSRSDETLPDCDDNAGRGEEINKEILKQLGLEMTLEQWASKSALGQLCRIVGCPATPNSQCPKCGNWFCHEHLQVHFHPADQEALSEVG